MVVDYHSRNVWNLAAFFRWNFQKIFLFFWKLFGTPWFDGVRACPSWWRCSRETRTGDWVRAGQPQSVCFKPKQVESHISLENSWVVYSGNRIKNTLFKEEADFRIRIPFLRKIYNWNLIFLKNQNFVKSWIQVNRLKRSIKWDAAAIKTRLSRHERLAILKMNQPISLSSLPRLFQIREKQKWGTQNPNLEIEQQTQGYRLMNWTKSWTTTPASRYRPAIVWKHFFKKTETTFSKRFFQHQKHYQKPTKSESYIWNRAGIALPGVRRVGEMCERKR